MTSSLESISKTLIGDYLATIKFLKDVKLQNYNVRKLVSQDLTITLKARCHQNTKMSQMAGIICKKYFEVSPIILGDFKVFATFHDCLTVLSELQ